ncbi:DUF488 domain-containing protein [Nodosilinea sp. E11]|uniref:DUF488 domain-containing protein n=1 Tax=Nodosilinea sp. E11 TaxID=3037479 RepID=UPI00293506B7|nr:DUF488 domain-containing protein [Nodosilinea sp. E11]WOD37215.1 DUF488 domain-containing protein [Nodosilinea sp. E11]
MTQPIDVFTIGFTQKKAQQFFELLLKSGVRRVIDTRLNNASQLAGFSKRDDLAYFLKTIGDIEYIHMPELAPTKDILDAYKKQKGDWQTYETKFIDLINKRQIEKVLSPELVNGGCLLCSEAKPHHCHRRLVAEYLNKKWGNVDIHHL